MYQIVSNLDGSQCIRWNGDGGVVLLIPMDKANTDYQAYLAWVAEGNEPEVVEL